MHKFIAYFRLIKKSGPPLLLAKEEGGKLVPLSRRHRLHLRFRKVIRLPRQMLWAMFMEGVETKQMIHTFARQGQGKLLIRVKGPMPTEEELQQAREQLRDIPKFLPFFVFIVMPLPGVTEGYALVAITLENWLGKRYSILPSQFRKIFEKESDDLTTTP